MSASPLPLGSYANDKTSNGPQVLNLARGGQYTQHVPLQQAFVKGTWKATGDQIEFTETGGGVCPRQTGTYKWAMDGKALSLTRVHDSCYYRAYDFESGAWVRQQ